MVILSPFSNVRKRWENGNKKPLVTDRWSLSVTGYFLTIFSPFEMGHKIRFMVRKLGHKRGHFITVFLQYENICKMVRKVINNLLFRQGSDIMTPWHHAVSSDIRTKRKTLGTRCFSYHAPTEWNKLPTDIRMDKSIESFKSKVKTFLFQSAYNV